MLEYFQNLKKATGATINLEKTTVLPINIDNAINIPNEITIKEQYETTKILGILFNDDLHCSNQMNWQMLLEKMENHINKLSPRILYLYGKVIITNTFILSKTSYISNTLSIHAKQPLKLTKNCLNISGTILNQDPWKEKQYP